MAVTKDGFDGRTYLFIRTNPSDTGMEPLPAGLPGWISPDIAILHPDGTRNGEANAGIEQKVEVYVNNLGGITATDAYVEVFVCNPSTVITPATATLIGSAFITVPGYGRESVQLSWIPQESEAGHRCLIARVCLPVPPDTFLDGSVFDVYGDRHVAQRNINIVKLNGESSKSFMFTIANPGKESGRFSISANWKKVAANDVPVQRAIGCGLVKFASVPLGEVTVRLQPGRQQPLPTTTPITGSLLGSGTATVSLNPQETAQASVNISVNPNAVPGELHLLEVSQWDLLQRKVIGGIWWVIQA
ncbi:hypothetical protein [Paenibacillus hamazuiensis]|uniref:hypothetical protein n=1 Tax=Paenibacillus hamazuiensis TaxID=2936508 RepID=UPI00200BB8FF|nr:hypothetical protein [Paenibacillus hamazuiensis]